MDMPEQYCRGAISRMWLLAMLLPLPVLAQGALLSHAEQPARLIRKTSIYQAAAGATLLPGDIVESGQRDLQIEWPNGALLALGPASSVQLDSGTAVPTVTLLRGWMKVAANKPANSQLAAFAGPLQLRVDRSSGILHLAGDKTELFVEQGSLAVTETDKAGSAAQQVNHDQYVLRDGTLALQVAVRAPRQFVSALPHTFYDPLVGVANRIKPAEPVLQHELEVADVIAIDSMAPLLHKRMVAQFAPRLNDPAFREAAETQLGEDPDWRQVLQKTAKKNVIEKRPRSISNYLF